MLVKGRGGVVVGMCGKNKLRTSSRSFSGGRKGAGITQSRLRWLSCILPILMWKLLKQGISPPLHPSYARLNPPAAPLACKHIQSDSNTEGLLDISWLSPCACEFHTYLVCVCVMWQQGLNL